MKVGLQPRQFRALLEYAKSSERGNRRNVRFALDTIFNYWLISGPTKSNTISNFTDEAKTIEDGEALWHFLENYFSNQQEAINKKSSAVENPPSICATVFARGVGRLVELFGEDWSSCDSALSSLGFSFDKNEYRKCWAIVLSQPADKAELLIRLEELCRSRGLNLMAI